MTKQLLSEVGRLLADNYTVVLRPTGEKITAVIQQGDTTIAAYQDPELYYALEGVLHEYANTLASAKYIYVPLARVLGHSVEVPPGDYCVITHCFSYPLNAQNVYEDCLQHIDRQTEFGKSFWNHHPESLDWMVRWEIDNDPQP